MAAALATVAALSTPTHSNRPARQAITETGDVVAPGPAVRADVTGLALAEPAAATLSTARVLQSVSVGGAVSWGELVSQAGTVPGAAEAGDELGAAVVVADLDGDGIADAVAGAPGEAVGSLDDAGGVTYVPGGVRRAAVGAALSFSQAGPVVGAAEAGDRFGASLAVGDFDGDGAPELAIGAPGEALGSKVDAGTVIVLPSDAFGPILGASEAFSQSTPGVAGAAEADDRFGESLAVGDFDNDGYDDLAVGIPGEDIGGQVDAGAVAVLYGGPGGLSGSGSDVIAQSTAGIKGAAEAGDRFGAALAAGDLDGDGRDELIVGVPGEDVAGAVDAGLVAVLFGSASGVSAADIALGQYRSDIDGVAEADDAFGASVAAGDLDLDGFADIVVGAPGETLSGATAAGEILVIPGSAAGPDLSSETRIHQATAGVIGTPEADDRFGATVLVADVVDSAHPDVVIGVAGEDVGSAVDAGALAIVPGTDTGVNPAADVAVSASSSGVPGAAENGDELGTALAAGDLNGDGTTDLLVGIPGEAIGSLDAAGVALTVDARAPIPWSTSDRTDEKPGDLIHVIYAIPADKDEARAMDAAIRVDVAVVDEWFRDQMGRDLEWDTFQGALDLSTVRLDQTEAEIATQPTAVDIVNLELALADKGFDDFEKGYLVYYEGEGSDPNTCGVTFSGDIAVMWLDGCGGVFPSFTAFPFGSTYLHAHELTHLLDAVSSSAPNHCCGGHVDDDNRDVLFQNPTGPTIRDWDNLRLDPGNDDYFEHPGAWPDIVDSDFVN